jgi:DNA-directed RNA polymerase II subunit RPB1
VSPKDIRARSDDVSGSLVPVTATLGAPPTSTRDIGGGGDMKATAVFLGQFLAAGRICQDTDRVIVQPARGGTKPAQTLHSKQLQRRLQSLVGEPDRRVPGIILNAPDDIVRAFLDAFVGSSDILGWDSDNRLLISTRWPDVAHGVSLLCSRLGIICSLETSDNPLHPVRIALPLFDEHTTDSQVLGDVMLDEVVELRWEAPAPGSKMYDLTVPSTLNFAIANGLHVRDTSETGYIQRKLIKFMEDCQVHHDLTVRNASGAIVQFLYGEDGMDATHIEKQYLPHLRMGIGELQAEFLLSALDDLRPALDSDTLVEVYSEPDWQPRLYAHYQHILEDRRWLIQDMRQTDSPAGDGTVVDTLMYPVNIQRIVAHAMMAQRATKRRGDLSPLFVIDSLEDLIQDSVISPLNPANRVFAMLLRVLLSPKPLLLRHGMTRFTFESVIEVIRSHFREALVHPGEMVGILAAQSIGEPSTQMTLNSFHLSGAKSIAAEAMRGVPRIRELMSTSPNQRMKSPFMTITLKSDYAKDQQAALRVMNSMTSTLLGDLVTDAQIVFDPDGDAVPTDKGFMNVYSHLMQALPPSAACDPQAGPWVLRMTLDKALLLDRDVAMADIADALRSSVFSQAVACAFSDDSAAQLVVRVRLQNAAMLPGPARRAAAASDDHVTDLSILASSMMENVVIRGAPGIGKTSLEEAKGTRYDTQALTFREFREWQIFATGSNLLHVLGRPEVDHRYCRSNDVNDTLRVLGIEAVRQLLQSEFSDLMKDAQELVNFRHIAILVDCMTCRGCILPVDRNGMKRSDIGPLAKCSFEETPYILVDAGMFADTDRINGVSANVMLGQIPPAGTGAGELLWDMDAMIDLLPVTTDILPTTREEDPQPVELPDVSWDLLRDMGIS